MDNVKFENQYEITKQSIKNDCKLFGTHSAKINFWFQIIFKLWIVFIAIVLLIIGFMFYYPIMLKLSLIYIILIAYIFGKYLLYPTLHLKRIRRILENKTPIQTTIFGDNIQLNIGNSTIIYTYDQVRFIEEKNDCIYFMLWAGRRIMVTLYKNSFTVGNADDFLAFFENKCSEKEPLWSKYKINKQLFKKMIVPIAIFIVFAVILPIFSIVSYLPSFVNPETVFQDKDIKSNDSDIQLITYEKVSGGAVSFGQDDLKRIHVVVMKKTAHKYTYVKQHYRKLIDVADYNVYYSNDIFESDKDELLLSNGDATVVYGVAYAYWWDNTADEFEKLKYDTVPFQCDNIDFILYYREV